MRSLNAGENWNWNGNEHTKKERKKKKEGLSELTPKYLLAMLFKGTQDRCNITRNSWVNI